ncbi:polar growth protein, partial [Ascosphaera atra]
MPSPVAPGSPLADPFVASVRAALPPRPSRSPSLELLSRPPSPRPKKEVPVVHGAAGSASASGSSGGANAHAHNPKDSKDKTDKTDKTPFKPFIFKLVPPKPGTVRSVQFTKPSVHYFQVDNIQQGRLWMAALLKATIDRDPNLPVRTTNKQKTISLKQAAATNQRPPALMQGGVGLG